MKGIAVRLVAAAAGFLLAILGVEAGLRISNVWIGRHSDTMFEVMASHDRLGWTMRPAMRTTIDMVDVEDIPVRSNRLGFWDGEFEARKAAGRCRIAFLGDSFTWGMGVEEGDRFSDRLETLDPRVETLNFGLPGFGTDQSLIVWEETARGYAPDVVVLTIFQNDYRDNMYEVRYGRLKPYFELEPGGALRRRGVPVPNTDFWDDGVYQRAAPPYAAFFPGLPERRSRIAHWLAKNSDLARLVYNQLVRRSAEAAPASLPEGSPATLDESERAQLALMKALVLRLEREVTEAGAHLLVALAGDPVAIHRALTGELGGHGTPVIDATTKVLTAALSVDRNQVYFPRNQHWTGAAHGAVAKLLATALAEGGSCDDAFGVAGG